VTLLIVSAFGLYFQSKLSAQGSRYSTVTGKGFRPRTMNLGRLRYPAAGLFILYFFVVVALPFCVLLWSSLQKYYSAPSVAALHNLSLSAYWSVLALPAFGTAIWNSFLLSLGSATLIMLASAVMAWIVVRTRLPGRWLIDGLASLPLVFPGLVLGLAIMICYLNMPVGIYGTLWIMLIAYVTRFLPYGMRTSATSMLQIHKELEESAAMSGASWGVTFRRIVLPLLKPGLLAGWIYIVIVSIRELSSSILLYSPGTEVMSIMIWELWQNGQYVELSALGVMMIAALFLFVMLAQYVAKKYGVTEG
jgi:iron(III) transport system permease protein